MALRFTNIHAVREGGRKGQTERWTEILYRQADGHVNGYM
jgi:hypothetical protein